MPSRAHARFRLEPPAPARNPAPAPAAALAERAGRAQPRIGRLLGLPLNGLHLRRIDDLQRLVGSRYRGWGRMGSSAGRQPDGVWAESTWDDYFVDVLDVDDLDGSPTRHTGETLHQALGAALRAARGRP